MMTMMYTCMTQSLHAIVACVHSVLYLKPAANGFYIVCKSLDTTLLFKFTVQMHIYPSVSKVHAGCFHVSVIHWTLTWTMGSLTCLCDNSYACIYTHGHTDSESAQHFWLGKKSQFLCVFLTGFNWTRVTDITESRVRWLLPIEPPHHRDINY